MVASALLGERPDRRSYSTFGGEDGADAKPSSPHWWSWIFFSFANPIMAVGNSRQLNQDDLWSLESSNRAENVTRMLKTQYEAHGRSIVWALAYTFGCEFLLCGFGSLVMAACRVFAPLVLNRMIDALSSPDTLDLAALIGWLGALIASRVVLSFLQAHTNFRIEVTLLRLTVGLKGLLFEKSMRRSAVSDHVEPKSSQAEGVEESDGEKDGDDKDENKVVDVSNLFTADMDNFIWMGYQLNSLWVAPIQIAVVIYLLYLVLDAAAFAGLAVILLSLGVNTYVAKGYTEAYDMIMKTKDGRMKSIKEVFGAIQIVKFNAWEPKFLGKIRTWREREMRAISKYLYMIAVIIFLYWTTPICVSVASFVTYALVLGKPLTAAKVFTSMMLFDSLSSAIVELPEAVQGIIQTRVSVARITRYMNLPDVDTTGITRTPKANDGSDVVVRFNDVDLAYESPKRKISSDEESSSISSPTAKTTVLANVKFAVERGDLVVVHGSVGAGKSSLCSALIGELPPANGDIFVRDGQKVAYYAQQPWIQNLTIRDNILFGHEYDVKRYQQVLEACCLGPDLKQFPAGDQTEIGQKGINLSGGQKARLALARACYADADIYVLDSPLAAVDAVVQSQIFSKCICGFLADKTIVLVTHNPEIVESPAANCKVLLEGTTATVSRLETKQSRRAFQNIELHSSEAPGPGESTNGAGDVDTLSAAAPSGILVEEEERHEGRVSKDVFMAYFNAIGGYKAAIVYFLILASWQGFRVSSDVWLSQWTGSKDPTSSTTAVEYNLTVYGLLSLGTSIFLLIRSTIGVYYGIRGARYLFDSMTQSLLHAPLRFFDANPIGRIVNRYAEDVSTIDTELQLSVCDLFVSIILTFARFATAMYIIKYAAVLIIPLGYIYAKIAQFYLAPSREITRLLKVATSPILSHVTISEEGVSTLRAFGSPFVQRATNENRKLIDENSRAWFAEILVNQWFAVRIQLIGCAIVTLIVTTLVHLRGVLPPGMVGLAFMYAVAIDGGIVYLVQEWSRLELTMVSPERVLEYIGIPQEGTSSQKSQLQLVSDTKVLPSWPEQGSITFEDVVFNYKPGAQPVLKGVSFHIHGKEKIGIVGRTGAGKSSMTMALFRINELVSGRILIDGVDIASLDLPTLRSRMSIIPQSPVLFQGSMRAYMDPFDEFDDAAIWTAFDKVGLKETVAALDGKLAHELRVNGENFSVGERQMLCLARALLRQSRIVIMDEATASIDHATERRLQQMIERELVDATVLTIAHRLATVLTCDRILVLSDGRAVEFDSPVALAKQRGVFYELAREGGYLEQLLKQ